MRSAQLGGHQVLRRRLRHHRYHLTTRQIAPSAHGRQRQRQYTTQPMEAGGMIINLLWDSHQWGAYAQSNKQCGRFLDQLPNFRLV